MLINYRKGNVNEADLMNSLRFLSDCLKQHYNKNVIILIDEYDVPLQNAYMENYYESTKDFIKIMFSKALKTNNNVEKGVFTGCLRISKESIFTGLNHFKVRSIVDDISNTSFGFTQNEVNQILDDYNLSEYNDEVKEWYDGYLFSGAEIYNPWSTLRYVEDKSYNNNKEPESYWANTSSNDLVLRYITRANDIMFKEFEQLIQGKTLTKQLNLELTYNEMDDRDNVYAFLLTTGYLKCIDHDIDDNYTIMIPNKEVEKIYRQSFMKFFRIYTEDKLPDLIDALLEYNEEKAQELLNQILIKDISY